jgi:hypothetical protein
MVPLADGQVMELGQHRVRHIDTPHVPRDWEARVLFEESTQTLLCGDLFTQLGHGPAVMHGSCFAGNGASALRALADDYDRRLNSPQPQLG